jgi:hypothetical protein
MEPPGMVNCALHFTVVCISPPGVVQTVWRFEDFFSRSLQANSSVTKLPEPQLFSNAFNVTVLGFLSEVLNLTCTIDLKMQVLHFFLGGLWPQMKVAMENCSSELALAVSKQSSNDE